jgi:hypothetical protein
VRRALAAGSVLAPGFVVGSRPAAAQGRPAAARRRSAAQARRRPARLRRRARSGSGGAAVPSSPRQERSGSQPDSGQPGSAQQHAWCRSLRCSARGLGADQRQAPALPWPARRRAGVYRAPLMTWNSCSGAKPSISPSQRTDFAALGCRSVIRVPLTRCVENWLPSLMPL